MTKWPRRDNTNIRSNVVCTGIPSWMSLISLIIIIVLSQEWILIPFKWHKWRQQMSNVHPVLRWMIIPASAVTEMNKLTLDIVCRHEIVISSSSWSFTLMIFLSFDVRTVRTWIVSRHLAFRVFFECACLPPFLTSRVAFSLKCSESSLPDRSTRHLSSSW